MQGVDFGPRIRIYPLRRTPATISTDALILILFLLAGYGLRALTEKRGPAGAK